LSKKEDHHQGPTGRKENGHSPVQGIGKTKEGKKGGKSIFRDAQKLVERGGQVQSKGKGVAKKKKGNPKEAFNKNKKKHKGGQIDRDEKKKGKEERKEIRKTYRGQKRNKQKRIPCNLGGISDGEIPSSGGMAQGRTPDVSNPGNEQWERERNPRNRE